jgi:hypothetical protein
MFLRRFDREYPRVGGVLSVSRKDGTPDGFSSAMVTFL